MRRARRATVLFLSIATARAAFAQGDPAGAQRVGEQAGERIDPRAIKPPKLVQFVEAEYPPEEKETGRQASVVLSLGISDTGTVLAVVVQESAGPAFDAAAVAAARRFLFEPAEVRGKKIPVKITYKYDFVIKQEMVKRADADFAGLVRDRETKKPLPGVKLVVDGTREATTDEGGRFAMGGIEPGEHTVTLSGEGLLSVSTKETFEASKKLEATYEVEIRKSVPGEDDSDFEVVVTAPRLGKQVVSTEIPAEQGRKIPGTQGDVLKVVENLPGVARSAVGTGQIVVWGAAPEDTQVFVEGMRIPRLYHNGGYRSVIHSDLVRSVELVPGGYGAQYGRGIGGLVTVLLRPIPEDRIRGSVAADVIDASASVSAPVSDKVLAAVAVRRSHLDSVVRAVGSGDVEDIVPLPRYLDAQARVMYLLDTRETLELGGLYSSDALDRTLLAPDPADTKKDSRSIRFGRVYLRYEKKSEGGASVVLVPSFGQNASRVENRFGGTPTTLDVRADVFGVRATYRAQPEKWVGVVTGVDVDVTASAFRRAGSVGTPPREGDVRVFGQAPNDQINVDEWHTLVTSLAPFAEADFAFAEDRVHIVPGLRFEPYVTSTNKSTPVSGDVPPVGRSNAQTALEPRLSARWQVEPRLLAKAAAGLYHQPPAGEDLSAVFGNPKLELSTARHVLAGAEVKLTRSLSSEVTGFHSSMSDLTSRSVASTPLLAEALVQRGAGRSFGVQLLLRQEQVGRFFGWVSYSIIRSLRTDDPSKEERPFDFDQSHVLTAVGSFDLGRGFEIGARARYATGFPRTPVVGHAYSPRTDRFEPVFGPKNGSRLPAFWQLDLRAAKRFKVARTEAEIYLDVQNVTNRQNPEEIVYSFDYRKSAYITGLPVLPVAGFKWTF